MLEKFINKYPVSKTLQFRLLPVGDTEKNFEANKVLERDKRLAENISTVKDYINDFHRDFIQKALSSYEISVDEYASYYYRELSENEQQKFEEIDLNMRRDISDYFKKQPNFADMFGKELIKTLLPEFLRDERAEIVEGFNGFSGYFKDFNILKQLIYDYQGNENEISFRIVSRNLPKYLDNCKTIRDMLFYVPSVKDDLDLLATRLDLTLDEIMLPENYKNYITQTGIDRYNQLIGGISISEKIKIKGINELISEYNQSAAKVERLPLVSQLHKQILSERTTLSFIPAEFTCDDEVYAAIKELFEAPDSEGATYQDAINAVKTALQSIETYDTNGIYVSDNDVSKISNGIFGKWNVATMGFENLYDKVNRPANKKIKNEEKYREKRRAAINAVKSRSLAEIQAAINETAFGKTGREVYDYIPRREAALRSDIYLKYELVKKYLNGDTQENVLRTQGETVRTVQLFLDAIKDYAAFVRMFLGRGNENGKDVYFIGDFAESCETINAIVPLYNKVRNYCTQKPYSNKKIKLNFDSPDLLSGWSLSKIPVSGGLLFRRGNKTYLGILNKSSRRILDTFPPVLPGEEAYEMLTYYLLPGPNKMLPHVFFSAGNLEKYGVDPELLKKYKKGTFKKGPNFSIEDCRELIDFFKQCIAMTPEWDVFDFHFSDTSTYENISDFYKEVHDQGYRIIPKPVPVSFINKLIKSDSLYLYELHRSDYKEFSTGLSDLHTLYFDAARSDANFAKPSIVINGGAEMFCREPSLTLDNTVIHKANRMIENKNPLNPKRSSMFNYDIIKNVSYTRRQYVLNLPLQFNFTAGNMGNLNLAVRESIRENGGTNIIGISMGESNLINVCVIDKNGQILEQKDLSTIASHARNGQTYLTDYKELILRKGARDISDATNTWQKSDKVKDIVAGYLNMVVNEVCTLIEKYDAVVAVESPNYNRSRGTMIKTAAYDTFIRNLVSKLNYMADKKKSYDELGGVLCGYQLTAPFESFRKLGYQNGFMFFVPAATAQRLDPTTGFTQLLWPKYETTEKSKAFFDKFGGIRYNKDAGYFEFDIDYSAFDENTSDSKKVWTLCSFGDRVEMYRSKDYDDPQFRVINLTDRLINLFKLYGIDYANADLKKEIVENGNKDFYVELMKLIRLMMQTRNKNPNESNADMFISPVKNAQGEFFCTKNDNAFISNPDGIAAYNIALKAKMNVDAILACSVDELQKIKFSAKTADWLEYIQNK